MIALLKKYRLNSLNERYTRLVQQAMDIQRLGNDQKYAEKMEEAELVANVIVRIESY